MMASDPELQNHHSEKCDCKRHISDNRRRRLVVAFDGTENEFGPQVRENLTRSSLSMWLIARVRH
jgi:uncharacterized protein (DUF2235 family)